VDHPAFNRDCVPQVRFNGSLLTQRCVFIFESSVGVYKNFFTDFKCSILSGSVFYLNAVCALLILFWTSVWGSSGCDYTTSVGRQLLSELTCCVLLRLIGLFPRCRLFHCRCLSTDWVPKGYCGTALSVRLKHQEGAEHLQTVWICVSMGSAPCQELVGSESNSAACPWN